MSVTPGLDQPGRDRDHAPLRHAGDADRAAAGQHQDRLRRDRQRRIVDPGQHVVVAAEDDRGPAVAQQLRRCRGGLDDGAVRRQRAPDDAERAALAQRRARRTDSTGRWRGAVDHVADAPPGHGAALGMQVRGELAQQGRNAAGRVEVRHQARPGRLDIGQHRDVGAESRRPPPAGTAHLRGPPSRRGGSRRWSSRRSRAARRSRWRRSPR